MPTLTIGQATFNVRPARKDRGLQTLRRDYPALLGLEARHVYFWDCNLAPDGNPPRPDYHVVSAVIAFDQPDAKGALDPPGAVKRAQAFMRQVGVTTPRELEQALLAALPPVSVRIPWEQFNSYLTPAASAQVVAWNRYLPLYLVPVTPPNQPTVLFGLPAGALFEAIRLERCIPLPPGTMDLKSFAVPQSPQPIKDAAARRFDEECERLDRGDLVENWTDPGNDRAEIEDEEARQRELQRKLRGGD